MPYIQTSDKTQLFYNDWGTGRPVVLIHGWPLSSCMWEYQAPMIAHAGYRVIAYDRRGFGKSDQPWTGYDYDTLADDLAALLTELDLKDVTLVGFSMGGGEVARYLSRHGAERVAQAALISSVTPFLLKIADNPDGVEKKVFDEFVDKLKEDRPAFLASFGKKFYGAGVMHGGGISHANISEEILHWTLMMALKGSPKATIDCVRAFGETDFRPDMKAFTMPTLVIHGTGDTTVPIDTAGRAAARAIPTAKLLEYDGSPHGLNITDKGRLTQDLLQFLGSS